MWQQVMKGRKLEIEGIRKMLGVLLTDRQHNNNNISNPRCTVKPA